MCTLLIIAQPTVNTPAMVSAIAGGNSVTITCTATGVPVPTINWTRADGITDTRYVMEDTSSSMIVNDVYQVTRNLTIMNVVSTDSGVYTCTASNVVDTVQSNVTVTVMGKLLKHILINFVLFY